MMKKFIIISYKQNVVISYKLGQSSIFVVEIIITINMFFRNKNVWLVNTSYINILKGKK